METVGESERRHVCAGERHRDRERRMLRGAEERWANLVLVTTTAIVKLSPRFIIPLQCLWPCFVALV